jgi:hypothetical protein
MKLTDSERELIEVLRDNSDPSEEFAISIRRQNGAWELEMSIAFVRTPEGDTPLALARGVGESFDVAWDSLYAAGADDRPR